MVIQGKLYDALKNKKIVLFSGAGVGQAAGLLGSVGLTDYIYNKARDLNYQESNDKPLERLSADLQNHPQFGGEWLTRIVAEYFCNPSNYSELTDHIKLLNLECLDSIFTTNYDLAFEQAAVKGGLNIQVRGIDHVSASNTITSSDSIICYKMHGCADQAIKNPGNAKPLVLSKRDWSRATKNRREMLKVLTSKVSEGCIVIFAGFTLSNGDNSDITRAVFEGNYDILQTELWQSNSCYALIRNASEEDKLNLQQDYACEVIDGDFSKLVQELDSNSQIISSSLQTADTDTDTTLKFKTLGCTDEINRQLIDDSKDSFFFWHDFILEEARKEKTNLDSWHEPASLIMLAKKRYIVRNDIFQEATQKVASAINKIKKEKISKFISVIGERGSGKSVVLLQLAQYCYENLKQPVIVLNENAFIEIRSSNNTSLLTQGWEYKTLDKLLHPFFNNEKDDSIPILIADNQSHRKARIEQLVAYLSNHGKPCLVLITEGNTSTELNSNLRINVPNNLTSTEIESLYNTLQLDRPEIKSKHDYLIARARSDCNSDLLIILYEWLDKEFRPFQQIITDTANTISKDNLLRQVYILIATFHSFGFKPSLPLIIRASEYPYDDVLYSINKGDYGIKLSSDSMVLYRHTLISERLLSEMGVNFTDQVRAIVQCIDKASASDVKFFKEFLDYLFSLCNPSFTLQDIEKIKESTEQNSIFEDEWDLHHKYAAYLARDANSLEYFDIARMYCDKALALAEDENNQSSIYHTLGNIEFKQYQLLYSKESKAADDCFDRAVDKFERSKQLRTFQTEHAYVTHIDFINFQLKALKNNDNDNDNEIIELEANKYAIFWEALEVIDKDHQHYLSDRVQNENNFSLEWMSLSDKNKQYFKENAFKEKPNKILFDCYIAQCLDMKTEESREEIFNLYQKHQDSKDPDILIPLMEGTKRAFLVDAQTRASIVRHIAAELFNPSSSISNYTRARGIRLLAIDSFVSKQNDYLSKQVLINASNLYKEIRPRFLKLEYLLKPNFYNSTGLEDGVSIELFLRYGANSFYEREHALTISEKFYRKFNHGQLEPKFTFLSTPIFESFLLKVPTIEISSTKNEFFANCIIHYSAFGMGGNIVN